MVDSLEYIYLDHPMMGPIMKYDLSVNYAVFYDGLDRILLYSRTGNFLRYIGSKGKGKGKGKGEYHRIRDLVMDEENNAIYALCNTNHIFKYDLQGKFLIKIATEKDVDLLGLVSPGIIMTHIANWPGDNTYRLIVQEDDKILNRYRNYFTYMLQKRIVWKPEAVKYTFNNQLHIKDKNDTLYIITENNIIPKYIFKNQCSIHTADLSQTAYDQSIEFYYVYETNGRLYYGYQDCISKKHIYGFYDKKQGKTYKYRAKTNGYEEVWNDLDDEFRYRRWKQKNGILMGFCLDFDEEKLVKATPAVQNKIRILKEKIDDEDPFSLILGHLK